MCFDCPWLEEGGCTNYELCKEFSQLNNKEKPMELYKKNLKLMAEHWNGKFATECNIEWMHNGAVGLIYKMAYMQSLRECEYRLTAAYVESLNPGCEAVEWVGEKCVHDPENIKHGWRLRKKGEKGLRKCGSCVNKESCYNDSPKPEHDSCGAPEWKCWRSRE